MNTKELIQKLNAAGAGWSPINWPEVPAVFVGTWDALAKVLPPDFPKPVLGERYAYWPDHPFPTDVDPQYFLSAED